MQSLRDKLLKAGLVTEEQSKKVEEEKARPPARTAPARPERPNPRPPRNLPPARNRVVAEEEAPIPKLPPLAGSKEHQRLEAKKQHALDTKIRELVLAHQVPVELGQQAFHFVTRKGKLRRMDLTIAQAKQLEEGQLAVVERPDPGQIEHALVPPAIAEQLQALSEKTVRFLNKPGAAIGFLTDEQIAATPKEDEKPAEEKPAEVWVAIKRA